MSGNPPEIMIDDLRQPNLTTAIKAAAKEAEKHSINLTAAEVIKAARELTGLDNIGPIDFKYRLEKWLDELKNDSKCTVLGRFMVFKHYVRIVSQRLWFYDLLSRHPEVDDQQIIAPIIITGPPRSGTTHLHGLIASDMRLNALRRSTRLGVSQRPSDLAALRSGSGRNSYSHLDTLDNTLECAPLLKAMRPMSNSDVDEEFNLLLTNFPDWLLDWTAIDTHRCHLHLNENIETHYRHLSIFLKTLQMQHGSKRWVLSCPAHSLYLKELQQFFPDATIIINHRDPIEILQSVATMDAYYARIKYETIDTDKVLKAWTDRLECITKSIIDDINAMPSTNFVNINFEDFMSNEIATLRNVYARSGLELPDWQVLNIIDFQRSHARHKDGRISYNLERDFNADIEAIRQRFDHYYDLFLRR